MDLDETGLPIPLGQLLPQWQADRQRWKGLRGERKRLPGETGRSGSVPPPPTNRTTPWPWEHDHGRAAPCAASCAFRSLAAYLALLSRSQQQRTSGGRVRMCAGAHVHAGVPPSWARKPWAPTDLGVLAAQYYGDAPIDLANMRIWRRKLLAFPKADSARPPYYGSFSRARYEALLPAARSTAACSSSPASLPVG